MRVKESIEELCQDDRLNETINNSINYGINQIISRVTQEKNSWMIKYITRIFKENILPLYSSSIEEDGANSYIKNFWEELSKTFEYDFGELEWHTLMNDTSTTGAVYFMQKLYHEYKEKFYQGPKRPLDYPIIEFHQLISDIREKAIKKEHGLS